jgi:integrase
LRPKKALSEKLTEIDQDKYVEDKKIALEAYLKDWLQSYKPNVSASTYKRYGELLNTVIKNIGKIDLLKLKPLNIQSFYSKLLNETTLSKSTVLKIHRTLNLALKQAVAWNMLIANPCSNVKAPRPDKVEMNYWTEEQLKQFLYDCRNERLYLHIALAAGTGMRLGKICALKWECVDTKKGEIIVRRSVRKVNRTLIIKEPKTRSSNRKIKIADDLNDLLKIHRKRQEKLIQDNGRFNDPDYISKNFHLILKNYDVPMIRFHDLRHTHATILLLHDVAAKVVSERLGHSTISITLDTYSHVLPNMQQAAAEKLNGLFSLVH